MADLLWLASWVFYGVFALLVLGGFFAALVAWACSRVGEDEQAPVMPSRPVWLPPDTYRGVPEKRRVR